MARNAEIFSRIFLVEAFVINKSTCNCQQQLLFSNLKSFQQDVKPLLD